MATLFDDLKNRIMQGQTIIIVGAGVSIAATNRHNCASWTGLLHDGVRQCADLTLLRSDLADILHKQIDSGDLDLLLSSADAISSKLGTPNGGEYRRWLRESVGNFVVV